MSDSSVWNELVAAHHRVEADHPERSHLDEPPVHRPVAAILACADARVPPSVVFGQEAGRVFVVRIAGNTATPAALASLDYAVAELGVELLVVMGHTGCGAVQAAATGTCGGYLTPVVEPICRLADSMPEATFDQLVEANVAATVAELRRHDGPVGDAARQGRLDIRGAIHDLRSGELLTVSSNTVPFNAAPSNAVPSNTVPSNAVSSNAAQTHSVPTTAVPSNAVPHDLMEAS